MQHYELLRTTGYPKTTKINKLGKQPKMVAKYIHREHIINKIII